MSNLKPSTIPAGPDPASRIKPEPVRNFRVVGGYPEPGEFLPALAAAGTGFSLASFRYDPNESDRRFTDYLLIGLLTIAVHVSLLLNYDPSAPTLDEEEVVPPKIPPMVQVALLRPPPKPVLREEPPPPPPPPKAEPPKPIVKDAVALKPKPVLKKQPPKPAPEVKPVETPKPVAEEPAPTPAPPPVAAPAPKPVEEKITEARADAGYLHNPAPDYPEYAQEMGWEGRVILKVRVLPSGNPAEIHVQKSSGKDILDDAAVKTVRGWKFVPSMKGKTPIEGWVSVPISFNLNN